MEPWHHGHRTSVLVAYDCPAGSAGEGRRRLRRLCCGLTHIQYSVFLGGMLAAQVPALAGDASRIIDPAQDRCVVVDILRGTWTSLGMDLIGPPQPITVIAALATATIASHRPRTTPTAGDAFLAWAESRP